MLEVRPLGLDRVFEIVPKRFGDERGFFCETYNQARFAAAGIPETFLQDNHSLSARKGTLRGLHFQTEPFAQAKLVRVLSGAIFDVAVDIRPESPDFGKWVGLTVSAQKGNQIFVPAGFAHGFVSLEDNTEIAYKVDNYYSSGHDCSAKFDDPALAIDWPVFDSGYVLSKKDAEAPLLEDLIRRTG
ncbi:MAG: dTDP-4-dehydrorhamnose 3,5-epimerase [Nitratireductor sp.]|nr:dTDP-4-dehydrorhamnose 3,5-epimerase [Nitratireductor sp.]